MHLRVLTPLLVALILSSLVLLIAANPLERSSLGTDANDKVDGKDEDVLEYSDFEDDDSDEFLNSIEFNEENVNSIMHLHRERGEVLVPCFGMWWPVGGGGAPPPTYYDYGGDYYGDYKRKRRRSRKKKKAAKMKKKKS